MSHYQGQRRFGTEMAPPIGWIEGNEDPKKRLNETFAYHTTTMANTLNVPILVFTKTGNMPALLSHYRPNEQIFAFTDSSVVRRRLALYHAVTALSCDFQKKSQDIVDCALTVRLFSVACSFRCISRCLLMLVHLCVARSVNAAETWEGTSHDAGVVTEFLSLLWYSCRFGHT